MLKYGTVKIWEPDLGWGIVAQDLPRTPDVFCHRSVLIASGIGNSLKPGTPVKLECEETPRGLRAVFVVLL